jgi:exopolyphosphatase / guanosine-5'-triphosphate,3'-diphosphate pyrophosphatase
MQRQLIAAIDVGSHALRMKIGELKKNGEFRELESFRKIAVLGHDTFTTQKVSFDSVERTCDILKDFKKIMKDYNVTRYIAMATSAIREARNRDYIVDQIRIKTGIEVKVISNSEEQYLTHKALKCKLPDYDHITNEGAVLIVIGAGSIQIATYKDGQLQTSQNVKMGALRIREMLSSIEKNSTKFHKVLEEYIQVNLEALDIFNHDTQYQHLIAVGGEMSIISEMLGNVGEHLVEHINKNTFIDFSDRIVGLSVDEIRKDYGVKKERAEIIMPSVLLFKQFIDRTLGDTLIVPNITLADGIIRLMYEESQQLTIQDETIADILANARIISSKYNANIKHHEYLERAARFIFDKTKRIHGLRDEKLLLRIACILHDVGKYISLDLYQIHSYAIIHKLELFGMSEAQMEMIANISRYQSGNEPSIQDFSFARLREKERVVVAKLVAIIRLATALDATHMQKLKLIDIKMMNGELVIRCQTNQDCTLEEWTFKEKATYFKEVYGILPVLKVKRGE